MNKVFIVVIEWNIKGDTGHDILAVTDADNITNVFRGFVESEKSESYLSDFFNEDGTLKEGVEAELARYEDTDKSFMLLTSDYEYWTNLYIVERDIIKKE